MTDEDGFALLNYNTPSLIDRNFAHAGYDRRHNFQLGFVYQLPWRSGKEYANVARAVIADWQLSGIFAAFTGTPFTVTGDGAAVDTPSNMQTANLMGEVGKIGEIGASGTYYDKAAWAPPGCYFRKHGTQPVLRPRRRQPRPVSLQRLSAGRESTVGIPCRRQQRDEHAEVRQPPRLDYERRVHADHQYPERVRSAAVPVGCEVLLLVQGCSTEFSCLRVFVSAAGPTVAKLLLLDRDDLIRRDVLYYLLLSIRPGDLDTVHPLQGTETQVHGRVDGR